MREKLLIVDKDPDYRRLIQMMVSPMYKTIEASNGLEGLQLLLVYPEVSLVLTEVYLPVANGFWLLEQAKKLDRPIRVILMSGDQELQTRKDLRDGFLQKPFTPEILIAALKVR